MFFIITIGTAIRCFEIYAHFL